MTTHTHPSPARVDRTAPRHRWLLPLQLLAAAGGAWQGMAFGEVISGTGLGVLLAANCALFGALTVQTLAQVADHLADHRADRRA